MSNYLPSIQKDTVTNMHFLAIYVREILLLLICIFLQFIWRRDFLLLICIFLQFIWRRDFLLLICIFLQFMWKRDFFLLICIFLQFIWRRDFVLRETYLYMRYIFSCDPSICSTVAFPPLENSDHVVASVSIDVLQTGCPFWLNRLWLFSCWLRQSFWSCERCSMGEYLQV